MSYQAPPPSGLYAVAAVSDEWTSRSDGTIQLASELRIVLQGGTSQAQAIKFALPLIQAACPAGAELTAVQACEVPGTVLHRPVAGAPRVELWVPAPAARNTSAYAPPSPASPITLFAVALVTDDCPAQVVPSGEPLALRSPYRLHLAVRRAFGAKEALQQATANVGTANVRERVTLSQCCAIPYKFQAMVTGPNGGRVTSVQSCIRDPATGLIAQMVTEDLDPVQLAATDRPGELARLVAALQNGA